MERVLREGIQISRPYIEPIPDCSLILPTPVGLPLNLNITQVWVASADGSVKISGMPTMTDVMRGRLIPNQIKADIDIKPT